MRDAEKKLQFEALQMMSEEFTSDQFANVCRRLGVTDKYIANGGNATFLHKTCRQKIGSTRVLFKIKNDENVDDSRVSEAIKILIKSGYKILKPKTEWVEL